MIEWSLILILILIIIGLILRLRVLKKTTNMQMEYISDLEDVILKVQLGVEESYRRITQIDHMGYFENNDHTGLIFKSLQNTVQVLYDFITEQTRREIDEKEEELNEQKV